MSQRVTQILDKERCVKRGDIGVCDIVVLDNFFLWYFGNFDLKMLYCWFSHDATKIQTSKLLILLIFYFHDVQEQLKANIHAKFCSEWVLGFVINYA